MNYSTEEFKSEIQLVFNLKFLKKERCPIDIGEYKFSSFPETRVNHYLIRSNDSDEFNFGEIDNKEIKDFVNFVFKNSLDLGLNLKNRYCFLTIDQGWLEPHQTLRNDGWHLDGLQGDEVPVKKLADCEFIWSDCLSTTFANQEINTEGLDMSSHNVFNWIKNQIRETSIFPTQSNHIYI